MHSKFRSSGFLLLLLLLPLSITNGQARVSELRQTEQQLQTALSSVETLIEKARSGLYVLRPLDVGSRAVPIAVSLEDFEGQIAYALANGMLNEQGVAEVRSNAAAYTRGNLVGLQGEAQQLRQRLQDTRTALAKLLTKPGATKAARTGRPLSTKNGGENSNDERPSQNRSGVDDEEAAAAGERSQESERPRRRESDDTEAGAGATTVDFQITSVSLPGTIKLNGARGALTVSWSGNPSFPVRMVYGPDSCPSGLNCSTVSQTFNDPENPLLFPGSVWCVGQFKSSIFFNYSVYLVDAQGVQTPKTKAGVTCVP